MLSAGKTFPLEGGRWMAEGQTDEGASVDRTDCFSIQHPLIRPCGPPSPLWGEGLRSAKQCPKPCFLSAPALDGGEKG